MSAKKPAAKPESKQPKKSAVAKPVPKHSKPAVHHSHHKRFKWLKRLGISLVVLIIVGYVAFQVSPWPGTLLIRYAFDKDGLKTQQIMDRYAPASGITSITNQQYRTGDKDAYLDVYYPTSTPPKQTLPTVVWVHGGAWVSGSKERVAPFMKILASHGYTTVAIDYSIAPEKHYPLPVIQAADSLRYLQTNAQRLHIDTSRFVLAGDSAGSQIASQVANIITNPSYAQKMNITPPLAQQQLKGMLLNCGAYDIGLTQATKAGRDFVHTVLWAYSGDKDYVHDPVMQYASVANYLTKNFPPSFITAGNADPLESQSLEFASRLQALGVTTNTLFYPANHEPRLPHEYQFKLDQSDAQNALSQMVSSLQEFTKP